MGVSKDLIWKRETAIRQTLVAISFSLQSKRRRNSKSSHHVDEIRTGKNEGFLGIHKNNEKSRIDKMGIFIMNPSETDSS
jgi:hypothetical protein